MKRKQVDLYLRDGVLAVEELQHFLGQFAAKRRGVEPRLVAKLGTAWQEFADKPSTTKYVECLPKSGPWSELERDHYPPEEPGIYGIFAAHCSTTKPVCFYLGISAVNVRARLWTHLGKDLVPKKGSPDYYPLFKWLLGCRRIFICYSTVPPLAELRGKMTAGRARRALIPLEVCLTATLRPLFLTITP